MCIYIYVIIYIYILIHIIYIHTHTYNIPETYSTNLQDSPTEAEPGRRTPPSGRVWLAKAKALVVDTVPTLNLGRCASTREGNTCVSMKIDVCAIVYIIIDITRISCVMPEVQYRD